MFKTAARTIQRNKVFSAINVAGLAIGIAVFILILEFIAFEWNANRLHKNFDNLYRIALNSKEGSNYYLPPGYAPLLKEKFPEIADAVSISDGIGAGVLSYGENLANAKSFRENSIIYVDGTFLNAFSFPIKSGNPSLKEPQTMAITSSMAKKIFGEDEVVGKTLIVSNQFGNTPYTINAVMEDIPANSDIKGNVFLSLHTLESKANRDDNDWADPKALQSGYSNIYLVLKNDASAAALASKMDSYLRNVNNENRNSSVYLQPFSSLHLAPSLDYPYQTYGSLKLVYMLGLVALLILGIAWVNYINLSTAQALKRAKETGVRKVLGANRGQLAIQFLGETFVLTIISVLLAGVFVQLFQPLFNGFVGKELSLRTLVNPIFLLVAFTIIIIGCIFSGGYVSFVLSAFKPVTTLKGKIEHSTRGIVLRKGLVVFQFAISIVFVIATIVLYKQLSYMQTENLGMKLDELLVIQGPTVTSEGQADRNLNFKNQLAGLAFVKKISGSNNVPGRGYNFSTSGITRLISAPGDEKKSYNMLIADQNFFNTYGIQLVQGRPFTENEALRSWNNEHKVILNQKAATQLGFDPGENIIGKKIMWGKEYEIVGLVKDYHHLSLRSSIEPIVYLASVSFVYFTVETDASNMASKIDTIEKMYKTSFPGNPFEYFFADDSFDQQYRQDKQLGNVFIASALVAIFIACLGLFGLAAFSAQQRVREIGVRKVLGADIKDIIVLLSGDFIILVIVAIIIGSPIAWWIMHSWLQEFPYRTSLDWWVFVLAGTAAIAIAVSTVSMQALRAAKMNPVKSLRSE